MKIAFVFIVSYLLGSISTGVLLSRLLTKRDIRKEGSGNAGTTNMLRVHGRGMGALTLGGDMLKGIIAVLIGFAVIGGARGGILGTLGAVLGHNFPCFFGFKGGKGIATSFGCLLIVFPAQTLFAFAVFLVVFIATHYVSAGSICAAVALPLAILITVPFDAIIWFSTLFLGALAIARHAPNIKRLLAGKENKIDFAVFKGKKP